MVTGPRPDVAEMAQAQSQSQDLNIRRRTLLAAGVTAGTLVASGLLSPAATAADTGGVSRAVGSNGFAEAGLPVNHALGGAAWSEAPQGFAGVAAHGRAGTTGGAGGRLVQANTPDQLRAFAKSAEPLVVILHGELMFPQYEKLTVSANKSFLGAGEGAAVVNAGFKLISVSNVVFRNFTVRDSYIPGDFVGKRPDNDRDPPAQRQPGQHRGVPRQQLPGRHLQLRNAGTERRPAGGGGKLLPGCPESASPSGPGR